MKPSKQNNNNKSEENHLIRPAFIHALRKQEYRERPSEKEKHHETLVTARYIGAWL